MKFKNRVIFLAVKVRMRPMGHIVDLYISEILNSSVSRHITNVGGGGRTGHVFKDIFRNVNMPIMATPTRTSFLNSTGFFFNVCIRYASYRVWSTSRKGRFAVFSHGRRFDKNSCMVCERLYANLNEVDVTHRPYRFFFHYHFLKLWLLFNKYNYARIYWSKICVYIEECILRPI